MAELRDTAGVSDSKIVYLLNALERDAPTQLMLEVARAARRAGSVCRIVAWSRGGALQDPVASDFGFSPLILWGDRNPWKAFADFVSFLRQTQPDIVHVTLTRPSILGTPLVRFATRAHIILTQNGVHEWEEHLRIPSIVPRLGFKFSASLADCVVAVSNAVARDLVLAGVVAPNKLDVIANGVDVQSFTPEQRRYRERVIHHYFPGQTADSIVLVGAAGNLRKIKGYDIFVEAASLITNPAIRFIIWGEGPERLFLEKAIVRANLGGKFVLAGSSLQMPECLAACDIFVQPSRREAFGLAAAEAMACGVPCVVTSVGGLPELVKDGMTGLVVPPEDPATLARSISYLVDRPFLRERLGIAARQRILERYTKERMCADYLHLYGRLLENSHKLGSYERADSKTP